MIPSISPLGRALFGDLLRVRVRIVSHQRSDSLTSLFARLFALIMSRFCSIFIPRTLSHALCTNTCSCMTEPTARTPSVPNASIFKTQAIKASKFSKTCAHASRRRLVFASASDACWNTADIRCVQQVLGHQPCTTTIVTRQGPRSRQTARVAVASNIGAQAMTPGGASALRRNSWWHPVTPKRRS